MDLQQKLTRTFLITFTLLMGVGAHYFQHNQGGSGLELAQNNIVWIFFSILIGLGLWKISAQKKVFYSSFTLLFLSAVLLFLIPAFYPNNALVELSYSRLIGLFAGLLLFISLQQFHFSRSQIQYLLLLIVLAGFLQACYSLMQDYLLPADNIFGYDVGYGRPYGIFQQPNVLASFMASSLILSGFLLQKISSKKLQIFLLLTAQLNMWVITITMSRTGYLGLLIALLLFIPRAWQNNKKQLGLFIVAISLGLGFAMLKGDALGARNTDALKEVGARTVFYKNSWEMIKEKPLMGYGYGSFEKNYLINQAQHVKNNEQLPYTGQLTHPHNDILFWAVEGGIVPILAILLLVVAFIRLLSAFKISYALAIMALVIPISLHTQTEYPLYHSALHWLVLLVIVFYVDSESEISQACSFSPTFAVRSFALLIPIFTIIFMVSNLYTIAKITEYERNKEHDIKVLLSITNPLVFEDRIEFYINYYRLVIATKKNNLEEIQSIARQTEDTIQKAPKSYFYHLLYATLMYSGKQEKAREVLDYARYLYPLDPQLANADKGKKQ